MVYKHYYGITKERISKLALLSIALLFAFTTAIGILSPTMASSHLLDPFTQDELDNNWQADRLYPSGGVKSVSFEGRDNVAEIKMDSSQASSESSWWGYEGIKKVDDFGDSVQVDLYVPSEWQEIPVNAGLWASDDPISAYPIIVYRNSATVDAGFYTWDGVGGYDETGIAVNYDDWNTLSISLDTENHMANYFVNGEAAGGITATSDNIGQVFLNQYNFGALDPENAVDYDVYWHVGVEEVELPPAKAAPAVASELLDEAGIKARYGNGRNGGNYIADVARAMDRGAYFDGIAKEDVQPYRCAVARFLNDKGADVNHEDLCYVLVEQFSVDSNDIDGANSTTLEDGTEYTFVVSGTWTNQNGGHDVDAGYNNFHGTWQAFASNNLQLQLEEGFVNWGEFNPEHVYQYEFSGVGDSVNFRIFDGNASTNTPNAGWYSDNAGSLSVEIYQKLY